MYLEKLSLHNYRGIRDMEIEFDRHLNVFVGDNGCGKTSIINTIECGVYGARINLVAGHEQLVMKDYLFLGLSDVNQTEKNAKINSRFNISGRVVDVVRSSSPKEIYSSVTQDFLVSDLNEMSVFPAFRQRVAIANVLVQYSGPEDDSDQITDALRAIKDMEDEENALFRWHIEDGDAAGAFVKNPWLTAIKKAISNITGFERFYFNNKLKTFEAFKKVKGKDEKLKFTQLSLGEQTFIGLIAAIACDVAIDADEEDPLGGERLIIIDEIDLHLHPKWQRRIVPALRETFPNCQFIITTHSPQVLSEVPAENIFSLYRDENGDIQYEKPDMSKGLNSSEILQEVMDLPAFSPEFEEELSRIYTFIEEEKFDEAKELIEKYETEFGEVPALIKARTVLELSE
ncbi:AAA family ATPase [Maridesulfovibrio sp.]|uniref:AAA family ATPase n=1 Tax=Maridesulfovibrio sp. TaxID=2795000 RepID=UPI002AA8D95D|nr:AAA family ATPase [Maridesulfovibrio sp.]